LQTKVPWGLVLLASVGFHQSTCEITVLGVSTDDQGATDVDDSHRRLRRSRVRRVGRRWPIKLRRRWVWHWNWLILLLLLIILALFSVMAWEACVGVFNLNLVHRRTDHCVMAVFESVRLAWIDDIDVVFLLILIFLQ